jgi:DNA (cytosine-5)-methyltransferase 1
MREKLQFVSFFAGARGLDIGLERAGLECIAANEIDPAAVNTIRTNAPNLPLYAEDIRLVTAKRLLGDLKIEREELFAIVGGPPCQAFSTAGRRKGLNDERGNVFLHFLKLITEVRPKYAVFENVRGLLSAPLLHRPHDQRHDQIPLKVEEQPGGALQLILAQLQDAGYRTTFNLYNTANFGVPQSRERLIFIASRDGYSVPHLQPTHSQLARGDTKHWVTLREAIEPIAHIKHHHSDFPAKRLEFYKLLAPGQNWRSLPPDLQREAMGESFNSGGGKTGFYRRLDWDRPSPTLVTRPTMKATDLCHPTKLRPLSVEEYAAIQTFPVDYKFAGNLDDQYRQIGNAVPCKFAQHIGDHLVRFENGTLQVGDRTIGLSRYSGTDELSWVGATTIPVTRNLFIDDERECA